MFVHVTLQGSLLIGMIASVAFSDRMTLQSYDKRRGSINFHAPSPEAVYYV